MLKYVRRAILALSMTSLLAVPSLSFADQKKDMEAAAEKAIGLMEKIADIIDKNKDACPKMGDELNAFADKNAGEFKKLKEESKKYTDADKKFFEEKFKGRMEAAIKKMGGGMSKCSKDEKVIAAMKKIGGA
jgi:hypothetical protein